VNDVFSVGERHNLARALVASARRRGNGGSRDATSFVPAEGLDVEQIRVPSHTTLRCARVRTSFRSGPI